ncbi:DUF4212 domain-containing protein [Xylophilus sp.]|uniref:DUF4212 domain-containing protein n=1 Tax=Xylophilus sp. TaxID=2653893 RepID=UPI0013BC3175|nr:sodium/substrate symporter small subunit [Xylophilus sp.]KAF1047071.1 MAG: hypothetical protein GAK38_02116 [Xylophilus sp.]
MSGPVPFIPDTHDSRHLQLKAVLLAVWVVFSFGVCFFARDLEFMVAGWPVNYWLAAQGCVLVFIGIVVLYAWAMNRFARQDDAAAASAESSRNG